MPLPPTIHPTDRTLGDHGLGKLDDQQASAVDAHLEACPACRERAAGLTPDSFPGRLRQGRPTEGRSIADGSMADGTRSFLQARAAAPPPPADTLPPGLADHPDYQIRRELGRGGMGVVYLAHNTMMGRDEVLKVMGRHIMERPGVLERFQREIRAVARLRHPNIVAAYHAFRIEGGLVFAMEYVEGLDLSRLVKTKGPLSVAHAAYFIHQAALGLQHAHEKGLIHRDIKPHNLMLTHDGKARLLKVLDFGLAKASREQEVDGGLTTEGQALGTPDYIAPEQIVNAPDVDIRADLYSLGGTLFYLLTGRPPFRAISLYDIYQAHMSREAEPLHLVRPEVPAELAALVAKLMAKEPKRRFQAPAEVADALTPFFRKGSTPAKPPRAESSQPARPVASVPAPPGPVASPPPAPRPAPAEPVGVRWEELIEERDREPAVALPARAAGGRRPPWSPRAIAAIAASSFALAALGVIIVLTIRRPDGSEVKITVERTTPGEKAAEPAAATSIPPKVPTAVAGPAVDRFLPMFNGEDLDGWEDVMPNGSEWKVIDGGLLEGRGGGPAKPAVLVSKRQDFANFRLRAQIRHEEVGFGWIELRRATNGGNTSAYFVRHGTGGSDPSKPRMGSITRRANYRYGNPFEWEMKAEPGPLEADAWHTLEVSAVGNRIGTSVNGKEVYEYVDPDQTYRSGAIALISRDASTVQFRKVEIEILPDDDRSPAMAGPGAATGMGGMMGGLSGIAPPSPTRVPPEGPARRASRVSGGVWSIEGDQLIKEGLGRGTVEMGDPEWGDYDLAFEGRKSTGPDGFGTAFRWGEGKLYSLVLGSPGNKHLLGIWSREVNRFIRTTPGTIQSGRWYKVKIAVRGRHIRVELDGQMIFDLDDDFSPKGNFFLCFYNSAGRFRNIKATAPDGTVLWEGLPDLPE